MKYDCSCIVDTPYALALYLLKMDKATIERTIFCVGNNLPDKVLSALPHAKRFCIDIRRSRLVRLLFRLKCWIYHLTVICNTQIFAQDHLHCAPQLICRGKYTLIEDGPNAYTLNRNAIGHVFPDTRNPFFLLSLYLIGGAIYLKTMGRNKQCENRWVTSSEDVRSFQREGVKFDVLNVRTLWQNASDEKRKMILDIIDGRSSRFDFSGLSRECKTILLTQPMTNDCGLSDEEQVALYRPFVERYSDGGVVVKPHPRDKLEYEHWFPNCRILRTRVPMQLLNAFGLDFDRVITICSSSVSDMSANVELIWIGTEANDKIVKVYGHPNPPDKFHNVTRGFV